MNFACTSELCIKGKVALICEVVPRAVHKAHPQVHGQYFLLWASALQTYKAQNFE